MGLAGLQRRLEKLEERELTDPDRRTHRWVFLEALPALVEVWVTREVAARLGGNPPPKPETETNFLGEAILGHPLFREEVARRVRVCAAEAGYRGPLPGAARWSRVCDALQRARRAGPRNAEERALLDAGDAAGVGTEEEERARVRNLVLRILSEVVGRADPMAR